MPVPTRRRPGRPDTQALDELGQAPRGGGRRRKAPTVDPVLSAGSVPAAGGPPAADGASNARRARAPGPAKSKVGFYQDPDDTARARAAYDWTRPHEGHRSFSDFIASAIMREVERLEAKHHDGQPWPVLEPGRLPTGKPLGA